MMAATSTALNYPSAPRGDHVDDYQGRKVPDPYRWLEDLESPQTKAWVEAERKLTSEQLAAIPGREAIRARLTALWNYPKPGLPVKRGGHYFFSKNSGLQNQPLFYVQTTLADEPRVLIDPNTLSTDGTVALTTTAASPDGKWLGYGLATAGSDWDEFHVREIATGKDTDDVIKWLKFSGMSWTKDAKGFFYARYPEVAPGQKVFSKLADRALYYHRLGTPQSADAKIFSLPDQPEWNFGAGVTDDGRYLVITPRQNGRTQNALYYIDLVDPKNPVLNGAVVKLADAFDANYSLLGNQGDTFFLETNLGAPRNKIIAVDLKAPAPANWKTLVPELPDNINSADYYGGRFVLTTLHDVQTHILVYAADGKSLGEIALPGIGGLSGRDDEAEMFYSYSSFLTPPTIFRHDLNTGKSEVFQSVKTGFDASRYVTEQVFYPSKDGTKIPMFITHRKDLKKDGSAPLWLYAYGGFNISMFPQFSIPPLVWVEMGGIYAQANLRGGGEYGEAWHLAGTKERKQNVFDDYISAADWVIKEGYTSRDRLVIQGRSNGGLLVGAVLNQRPDLAAVAFPQVGVMDMLRFHKFTVGASWASDYGNSDTAEGFAYLRAYSPVHTIKAGAKYPSVFVTTGDHDDRVFPAHSYKYAAALQAAVAGAANPALIRIDTNAGHGGSSGTLPVAKTIAEWTDMFAFASAHLPAGVLKLPLMNTENTSFTYPASPKGDVVDDYHGTKVADPYRWLEDLDSPQTTAWVAAENKLTFGFLEKLPQREFFKARLTKLWNYPKFGLPFKEGGQYFYNKNDGLQNQAVLYVQSALDAPARVLLDPNTLAKDGTVAVTSTAVSHDGKWLAYGTAASGSDWNEFHVRNIATGQDTDDLVKWVKFSGLSWTRDSKGFFYSRYDEPKKDEGTGKTFSELEHQKLYYHRLGTPQSADVLVAQVPENPKWFINGGVTEDGRYLIINLARGDSNDTLMRYVDLGNPDRPKIDGPVVPLISEWNAEYGMIGNDGPVFLVQTNLNAPRKRVIAIDTRQPEPAHWQTIVPESTDVIESTGIVGGKLVVQTMHDASSRLTFFTKAGKPAGEVALPGLGSVGGFTGREDEPDLFYSFTSFTYPTAIFRRNLDTGAASTFRSPDVSFDPAAYETKQIFYKSKDGTQVPMFIVHKKGLKLDGKNPTLLYAYGGFDVSMTPGFSVTTLVWLEQGGVYALPNLRGGGEYGREWHEAGTKERKQNVFDDYIAAAEWMFANHYTSSDHLVLSGGSNGGLLVGATVNQRPDLARVAWPAVGVMDMLRFHKFTIGYAWVADYGSSDTAEGFNYLRAYSPVHTVKPGVKYPAVLVTTADHDDRVFPAHSFKYTAAMQAAVTGNPDSGPVMIRIETKAGHGAGKPTSKIIEEAADKLAFAAYFLDMDAN